MPFGIFACAVAAFFVYQFHRKRALPKEMAPELSHDDDEKQTETVSRMLAHETVGPAQPARASQGVGPMYDISGVTRNA